MTPQLSVVVPYRLRPELVHVIHEGLIPAASGIALEVTVVEFGPSDEATARRVARAFEGSTIRRLQWLSADVSFNKARCVNVGLHESHADVVLLLDADVMVSTDFLSSGRATTSSTEAVFLAEVCESDEPGCVRPAPGILIARRADLVAIGGMNSDLVGWGFEDLDLLVRLRRSGINMVPYGKGMHLSHGDEKRDIPVGLTKDQSDLRNRAVAYSRLRRREHLGTLAQDVTWWRDGENTPRIKRRHWGTTW